jgi:glyoxylase-like metal-dependent hydrolase (beta-lactamase superfamily II)
MAAIRKLSNKPIRNIINTTLADDHTGANAIFVKAGSVNQAGPGVGGRPNEAYLRAAWGTSSAHDRNRTRKDRSGSMAAQDISYGVCGFLFQ